MRLLPVSLLPLALLVACASTPTSPYAAAIEEAHSASIWRAKGGAMMDVELDLPGKHELSLSLLTSPDAARTRLKLDDGTIVVSTGDSVHVTPVASANPKMRFHALTWSYFLSAPFKLSDPGANLVGQGETELNGRTQDVARLTFGAGVGDTPDDWYMLYRDSESSMVSAMAYVVTFGRDPKTVTEDNASAIVYTDFQEVEGVPIPMTWNFHKWSKERGPHGPAIGQVRISNFRFTQPAADAFDIPADSTEVPIP